MLEYAFQHDHCRNQTTYILTISYNKKNMHNKGYLYNHKLSISTCDLLLAEKYGKAHPKLFYLHIEVKLC